MKVNYLNGENFRVNSETRTTLFAIHIFGWNVKHCCNFSHSAILLLLNNQWLKTNWNPFLRYSFIFSYLIQQLMKKKTRQKTRHKCIKLKDYLRFCNFNDGISSIGSKDVLGVSVALFLHSLFYSLYLNVSFFQRYKNLDKNVTTRFFFFFLMSELIQANTQTFSTSSRALNTK